MTTKRTALQVVKQILNEWDAHTAYLVHYTPGEDEYVTIPRQIPVLLSELDKEYSRLLAKASNEFTYGPHQGPHQEIGISSKFLDKRGNEHHLLFADLAEDSKLMASHAGDIMLASSDKGRHIYRPQFRAKFTAVCSALLNNYGASLDLGWLAAGISQGFNVLRLSSGTDRFKEFGDPREV